MDFFFYILSNGGHLGLGGGQDFQIKSSKFTTKRQSQPNLVLVGSIISEKKLMWFNIKLRLICMYVITILKSVKTNLSGILHR